MVVHEYGGLKVTNDLSTDGDIKRLKKGDVVQVTEIKMDKNAVRGRVDGGWITLIDTYYNYRFANLKVSEMRTLF